MTVKEQPQLVTNMNYKLKFITLMILLGYALITDIRNRKVYNKTILLGLCLGIIENAILQGRWGIINGLAGFLLAFILLIIPFSINGIGGGDVKLLMMIGFFMGYKFIIKDILIIFLIGGIISFSILIKEKKLILAIKNIVNYLVSIILCKKILPVDDTITKSSFPYVIAIFIGTFICILIDGKFQVF